jgi:hypothetical protein
MAAAQRLKLDDIKGGENMPTIEMQLTRPAAKQGGDRYEAEIQGEAKPWVVYVPQWRQHAAGIPNHHH